MEPLPCHSSFSIAALTSKAEIPSARSATALWTSMVPFSQSNSSFDNVSKYCLETCYTLSWPTTKSLMQLQLPACLPSRLLSHSHHMSFHIFPIQPFTELSPFPFFRQVGLDYFLCRPIGIPIFCFMLLILWLTPLSLFLSNLHFTTTVFAT